MTENDVGGDENLRELLARHKPRNQSVPPFESVFEAAQRRYGYSYGYVNARRASWRVGSLVAAVIVAAAGVLVFSATNGPAEPDFQFIEIAELTNSIDWRAPSDVLLPDYSIDLYEDLPATPVSTDPAEGALL